MIVGLGNPGPEYENTRHNAGFIAVDSLAKRLGGNYWKSECGAVTCAVKDGVGESRREMMLVKPMNFMNTSGNAVANLAKQYAIKPEDIIIIHDELDLDEGVVRLKFDGGHGGHNGQRSIIEKLGTTGYCRVRAGIGRPPGRMPAADYVLAQLRKDALEELKTTAEVCADAALMVAHDGIISAQNRYNVQ